MGTTVTVKKSDFIDAMEEKRRMFARWGSRALINIRI